MSEPFGPAGWGPGEVAIDESAPAPPLARGPWVRVGVVAGLLAVGGIVIAIGSSGSDGDTTPAAATTTAPVATTAPRPVETQAPPSTGLVQELPSRDRRGSGQPDGRVLLSDPPPGFESVAAGDSARRDEDLWDEGGWQVFAAPGATWATGPWIAVDTTGIAAQFVAPPATEQVGAWSAQVGRGAHGDRLAVVTTPRLTFSVVTQGLPSESATQIAAAITIGGSADRPALAVPRSALPPGAVRLEGAAMAWVLDGVPDSGFASYAQPDGGSIRVGVRPAPPGGAAVNGAAFFLEDVRYLTVDGEQAIAGRWPSGPDVVLWQSEDRVFQLTSVGVGGADQLAAASSVVVPGDPGFSEEAWRAAEDGRPAEIDQATIAANVPVGDTLGTIWAVRSGDWVSWWLSSRDVEIHRTAPVSATPTLQIAVASLTPDRLDEGFTVAAMVLGDASLQGATLRLRAGDATSPSTQAETSVHEIIDAAAFAGQWGAGTSVIWTTGGIVAELIAPDGATVLASATEADLA